MIKSPTTASSAVSTTTATATSRQPQHQQTALPLERRTSVPSSSVSGARSDDELDNDDDDNDNQDFDEQGSCTGTNDDDNRASAADDPAEQYRDFFLSSTHEIKSAIGTPPSKRKGPRGGVISAFPVKLHEMLSSSRLDGSEHIVSWLPHGRAFTVRQPCIFVNELMPRYFKQSKMTSFQRQLNLYGFLRKTDGNDRGSYYHELFLRGRPDLAKIMVRTRVKGDTRRRTMVEPDFYNMPYCPDDPDPRQQHSTHRHSDYDHHYHRTIQQSRLRSPDQLHGGDMNAPIRTPRRRYFGAYRGHNHGVVGESQVAMPSPTLSAEVSPYSPSSRRYPPATSNYPPNSLGLVTDVRQAPRDSEWTPPPFPDLRSSQRPRRERRPPQVIQPSGTNPHIVSPDARSHRRSSVSYGSTHPPDSSSRIRQDIPEQHQQQNPYEHPPHPYYSRTETREEQAEFHRSRLQYPESQEAVHGGGREHHHQQWMEERYASHLYYHRRHHHHDRCAQHYGQCPPRWRPNGEGGTPQQQFVEPPHFEPYYESSQELHESDRQYL